MQNQRLGDVFELRAALQEMMSDGRGVRKLQDVVLDKAGNLRNGADIITSGGDVIQLKNYGGDNWAGNLTSAIKKQAETDFQRYGLNGWTDSTGQPLSGLFEFQFNARRLLMEGVSVEQIDALAQHMTNLLKDKWSRYGITHIVRGSF